MHWVAIRLLTLLQYWIWLNCSNIHLIRWCYIWDLWENYKNKPWTKNKASVFCFKILGSNLNASPHLCETFYIGSYNYRCYKGGWNKEEAESKCSTLTLLIKLETRQRLKRAHTTTTNVNATASKPNIQELTKTGLKHWA